MADGWRKDPTEDHYFWYEMIGHVEFDEYELNTREGSQILLKKIGYAIYDKPLEVPRDQNEQIGYGKRKLKHIKEVAASIRKTNTQRCKNKSLLQMSIVFVYVETNKQLKHFPVFRILLNKVEWQFVDRDSRFYSTWEKFLSENKLPAGKFCWPKGGVYHTDPNGKLQLGWGVTPNSKIHRRVLAGADTASSAVAIGATSVIIAGMVAPVMAPVTAVAGVCASVTGAYSAVRSGAYLVDRKTHRQTVNPLSNMQAAASWLSVVGSTVGLAAGSMVSRAANLARSGQVMKQAEQVACNALNVTSLAVNFTGVGISGYYIFERIKGRELTALDVFQFSASLLFFAHCTANFKTASSIIENNQRGVLGYYEKGLRSNRHRKQFNKLVRNTVSSSETTIEGNAKVIRSIKNIDNMDDFYAGMVRIRRYLSGHKAVFSESGKIVIHPMKMYQLGKQQRLEVLSLARQAVDGTISRVKFVDGFDKVTSDTGRTTVDTTMQAEGILTWQLQDSLKNCSIGVCEIRMAIVVVDELTELVYRHTNNRCVEWWHIIWTHVSRIAQEMLNTYKDARQFETLFSEFMNGEKLNLEKIQNVSEFVFFLVKIFYRYKNYIDDLIRDIKLYSEKQ